MQVSAHNLRERSGRALQLLYSVFYLLMSGDASFKYHVSFVT